MVSHCRAFLFVFEAECWVQAIEIAYCAANVSDRF